MYELSSSSPEEVDARVEGAVRQAISFSGRWTRERPLRPHSLGLENLTLDLHICLINAAFTGEDRISFAHHFIIRNEPWPDRTPVTPTGVRHSVILERVSSSGEPFNDDSSRFERVALSDLGMEPNIEDNLYNRCAYAVAYDDVVGSPETIIKA